MFKVAAALKKVTLLCRIPMVMLSKLKECLESDSFWPPLNHITCQTQKSLDFFKQVYLEIFGICFHMSLITVKSGSYYAGQDSQ